MRSTVNIFRAGAAFLLLLAAARADVTLPDIFSDAMVLQQAQKVPVWGKAAPGERVTVEFAGQSKTASTAADGNWKVMLDPLAASSEPRSLTISGMNRIVFADVLVGEVWLVSGQSNMQLTLPETNNGDAVVAAASDAQIRLFNVSRRFAFGHETGRLGRWLPVTSESVRDFSAAGYYFAVELRKALNVPIGIINSSFGGSQAEAWTPVEYLRADLELVACVERTKIWDDERPRVQAEYAQQLAAWRVASDQAKAQGARPPAQPREPDALREYRIAASIYDRMIAPLIPFRIRGNVWYQGESNEARAEQYTILLPTMIRAWRERWGEGDFPFGIVQLPNYRDPQPAPADEPWSFVREAQRRSARTLANTGLIVTIDIGEAHDIHPKDKLTVGRRMALWALQSVYGKPMTASGPLFRDVQQHGARLTVRFSDAGKGLRLRDGSTLDEFAVAGADRQWRWAHARITGRDRVEVWADAVPHPQAVRYAFNNNPRHPNLTNESGLPAAPFRSDDWPDPTHGKR